MERRGTLLISPALDRFPANLLLCATSCRAQELMARQSRIKASRTPRKRPAPLKPTGAVTRKGGSPPAPAPAPAATLERKAPVAPAPPPARKPGYYEAIAIYETGVRALQRHNFAGAAEQFRTVIDRYPEERELHERSLLYLRVCERETARRPATPQTPQERVYAATVALNAGDHSAALDHLRRALDDAPDSDHAHYIMAVVLAARGQTTEALDHLRRAISLNPDNRSLARQDPDLEGVRDLDGFREALEVPAALSRSRSRRRR
jgi:tetratricopeptide (TPR) repeat protein